jgi:hypothetical protein
MSRQDDIRKMSTGEREAGLPGEDSNPALDALRRNVSGRVESGEIEPVTEIQACRWWALCANAATRTESHPILGEVPICDRCTAKLAAIEGPAPSVQVAHERTPHEQEAYERGVKASKAAASWVIDGNTKPWAITSLLKMMDEGDPAVDDYLPAAPNLSGEYAGDPTPISLACDIVPRAESEDELDPYLVDALADAFEEGVSDTFMSECERILREVAS